MEDIVRIVAVAQMLVLLVCGYYLHLGFGKAIPGPLYYLGFAYGAVLVIVAMALMLNALVEESVTPGAYLLTGLVMPPTVFVVLVTVSVMRGSDRWNRRPRRERPLQ